jgi:hypothetical protein
MVMKYDLTDLYTYTCHSPILVSSHKDETDEELIKRWEKFRSLPDLIKEKISESPERIARVTQELDLSLEQAVIISRFVRKYYFGEAQIEMLPILLAKNGVTEETAERATEMIDQLIFKDDSIEKKYWEEHDSITLAKALRKYPNLGDQVIASGKINVKGYREPVRASINNWITDYTTRLGYKRHSSMERGNYLYKEETTKTLDNEERQRLSQVLKSFDENSPLIIKTKEQEVVFDQNAAMPSSVQAHIEAEPEKPIFQPKEGNVFQNQSDSFDKIPGPESPNQGSRDQFQRMSFSSPQKMAYEKNQGSAASANPNTVNLKNIQLEKKPTVPEQNIVNLKELEQ